MSKGSVNWENLFTYETLVHAIAGSAGSITAMSTFYPLDTVRSRLQVEDNREAKNTLTMLKELIDEEGFESLYRGLEPVLTSVCISNFVYFYTFHGIRGVFTDQKSQPSAIKDLLIGSLAGAVNVLLTTPFWVVNTRMKMQGANLIKGDEHLRRYPPYKSIFDGLQKIAATEGAGALWSSTLPSLVLVSNPAIQFMLYEQLKRQAQLILQSNQLNSVTIFLLGAIAKSISTVMTYPLQVVQSKLRYGSDEFKGKGMMEIFARLIAKNGFFGLYKGMESKLLQTVLTTALMFLCYEKIARFVFQLLGTYKPKSK